VPSDDEYAALRQRRIKMVAWVVIVALIVAGGGAAVLALLFG
jgi:hypothetical protein